MPHHNPSYLLTEESDWYELPNNVMPFEIENAAMNLSDETTQMVPIWEKDFEIDILKQVEKNKKKELK